MKLKPNGSILVVESFETKVNLKRSNAKRVKKTVVGGEKSQVEAVSNVQVGEKNEREERKKEVKNEVKLRKGERNDTGNSNPITAEAPLTGDEHSSRVSSKEIKSDI